MRGVWRRAHLIEIGERIEVVLDGVEVEESTRAHLEESLSRIEKVLDARAELNRP